MTHIHWLPTACPPDAFPEVSQALSEPNGLLAAGGDLSTERLIYAYTHGIFPWYSDHEPILWWSPNPRAVLYPSQLKISRSLKKVLNRKVFNITLDSAFRDVLNACAEPRHYGPGTWLTVPLREALCRLHAEGIAHSVECWIDGRLVGGLYGLAFGKVFFGESMFSKHTNASKVALVHLVWQLKRWNFALIDCQVESAHLSSLGATNISREDFVELLNKYSHTKEHQGKWQFDNEDIPHQS